MKDCACPDCFDKAPEGETLCPDCKYEKCVPPFPCQQDFDGFDGGFTCEHCGHRNAVVPGWGLLKDFDLHCSLAFICPECIGKGVWYCDTCHDRHDTTHTCEVNIEQEVKAAARCAECREETHNLFYGRTMGPLPPDETRGWCSSCLWEFWDNGDLAVIFDDRTFSAARDFMGHPDCRNMDDCTQERCVCFDSNGNKRCTDCKTEGKCSCKAREERVKDARRRERLYTYEPRHDGVFC